MSKPGIHAVLIGGGTGTSSAARRLKRYGHCTGVLTTCDDGGSSQRIAKGLKMGPPGDIRQFLNALADEQTGRDLEWRFAGKPFYGHPLGNIVLAALIKQYGLPQGIERYRQMYNITDGTVIPMTPGPLRLRLKKADGSFVYGESRLGEECAGKDYFPAGRIPDLTLLPHKDAVLCPEAIDVISTQADVVVVGPGKWYTSVTPPMLAREMKEALLAAKARGVPIICVVPIMTHSGQTVGLCAAEHVAVLETLLGEPIFTDVIVNTKIPDQEHLDRYAKEDESPVQVKFGKFGKHYRVYTEPLLSDEIREQNAADLLVRTVLRHNPGALGDLIMEITLKQRRASWPSQDQAGQR